MEDDLEEFFLEYEISAKSLPLHFNSDCEISNGLKKIIEGLLIVKPDARLNFERFFRYFSEAATESSWTNSLNIKYDFIFLLRKCQIIRSFDFSKVDISKSFLCF
jgi:hypothetical protein